MATEAEVADLPSIGFGTFDEDIGSEAFVAALTHALRSGYRHIDSAELYGNTVKLIGQALQQSEVPRASVFVTTKLKGTPSGPFEAVETRVRAHLSDLSVEYVDLLLIHWPGQEDSEQPASFEWFKANIASAWENMIRLKQLGLARRIGVSNFYKQHIEELLALNSSEKPFANEIFIDLAHQHHDFVGFMQNQDIRVIAYRPVAYLDVFSMFPEGEQIQSAAERLAVDSRQLVLALLISRGISVLVRSSSPEHIENNLKAVQLATSIADPKLLAELDQNVDVIECGGDDDFAAKWQTVEQ